MHKEGGRERKRDEILRCEYLIKSVVGFHIHGSSQISHHFDDALSGVLVGHEDGLLLPVIPVHEVLVDCH